MSRTKLLELYCESGINEIISETPINRLDRKIDQKTELKPAEIALEEKVLNNIESEEQEISVSTSNSNENLSKHISTFGAISKLAEKQKGQPIKPLISMAQNIAEAKSSAERCQNLEDLKKAVHDFDGCSLKKMATNTVFADGNPESEIMIIGEAPENHEDLQGIPFCGDSGKLLGSMFKAIGMRREDIYVTNILFWRPPGNRRPTADELAMCKPFVEKQISLMKPKLIVLMGASAMAEILNIKDPISKACGKFFDYQNQYLESPIKSTILFHPNYLMRQPSKKRETWTHLISIKEFLKK
ncbi:MAG: DNA polymerase [Rickettsiales bacterium]|jgi:DNA polymerase